MLIFWLLVLYFNSIPPNLCPYTDLNKDTERIHSLAFDRSRNLTQSSVFAHAMQFFQTVVLLFLFLVSVFIIFVSGKREIPKSIESDRSIQLVPIRYGMLLVKGMKERDWRRFMREILKSDRCLHFPQPERKSEKTLFKPRTSSPVFRCSMPLSFLFLELMSLILERNDS